MENWRNQLYFGDNLEILRQHIPVGSVDLIYLDPPFNSNATYNVLFAEKSGAKSAAQITAFEDTWHWGREAEAVFYELMKVGPRKLADLLQALRSFLGARSGRSPCRNRGRRVRVRWLVRPVGCDRGGCRCG